MRVSVVQRLKDDDIQSVLTIYAQNSVLIHVFTKVLFVCEITVNLWSNLYSNLHAHTVEPCFTGAALQPI